MRFCSLAQRLPGNTKHLAFFLLKHILNGLVELEQDSRRPQAINFLPAYATFVATRNPALASVTTPAKMIACLYSP